MIFKEGSRNPHIAMNSSKTQFSHPVTNPSRGPHTSIGPDKCQFCSSRFTCQEIKTHRMSYFRRKRSRILETDDAFFQPIVILLLHQDIAFTKSSLWLSPRLTVAAFWCWFSSLWVKVCGLRLNS